MKNKETNLIMHTFGGNIKYTTAMIKTVLTTFLFFICLTAFGQKNIVNKLTEEHQNVKGTKISLIPPKGFTDGLNFLGLQQVESGSSIMILDIPGEYITVNVPLIALTNVPLSQAVN